MSWITQAFIAMLSISSMVLIFKRLTQFDMKPEIINFFFFLFTTLAFLVLILFKKTRIEIPTTAVPLFILIAIIAVVYNYFSISAIGAAPNPGYVEAIYSFRIVIILIASIFLFGSSITLTKMIGVVLCVIGLILVSL